MAAEQNIEKKPIEKQPWTFHKLFPVKAMASAISKTLVSIFDFILVYLILVISLTELTGHNTSWGMWIFTILIFLAVLSEHNKEKPKTK